MEAVLQASTLSLDEPDAAKVAVTLVVWLRVTEQVAVPLQLPPQPEN
jgi:hypothetical protein